MRNNFSRSKSSRVVRRSNALCGCLLVVLLLQLSRGRHHAAWSSPIVLAEALSPIPAILPHVCKASMSSTARLVIRGGGRASTNEDRVQSTTDLWESSPTKPEQARLIILQVTDVYTLENFASFKTLLQDTREKAKGSKVICMLTGDFLSPYLLASIDRGFGMMNALNKIPMDYLTWGNHEADVKHKVVCRHVRGFVGKWLNSNMLDHEAMDAQQEYDVIDLESPDGTNKRKVGMCAVLSNDPDLYSSFKAPGAFGGATLTDPWEALTKYKNILENEEDCDLVVPLQHTYVPDDHKTCKEFDFPVILSGHDHHRVDEVVDGTRLLKPGMNAIYATVLEISWENVNADKPKIRARFVKTSDWEPDVELQEECDRAYEALLPLRNTELAEVGDKFQPLSSSRSREAVCTMGTYICTLLRNSLNWTRRQRGFEVDCVLLMGGNIRGNADYEEGSYFSLEALEAEIKGDEVIATVKMPGWLLAEGIQVTHTGEPIPGWMQYDDGVEEDYSQNPPVVTHVGGEPINPDRVYRVATKISDLTNGQSPPWTKYFKEHPYYLPPKGAYVNIQAELMSYFARTLWWKLWHTFDDKESGKEITPLDRLMAMDKSGYGVITVEDIQRSLKERLVYSVDESVTTLAEFVHATADVTEDGLVTLEDFQTFRDELLDQDARLEEEVADLELASAE